LALGELVEDLIWVGDPKQAIYSFRDADPELMLGVLREIRAGTSALGEGTVDDLEHSWRSQDQVLELVGQVFPRIFPHLPREQVVLSAAPEAARARAERGHPPGRLEAWIPQYSGRASQAKHARGIADGVLALLQDDGVGPQDVAVLVRSNAQAAQVVEALTARGVPASGEGVPVPASLAGPLLRAALAGRGGSCGPRSRSPSTAATPWPSPSWWTSCPAIPRTAAGSATSPPRATMRHGRRRSAPGGRPTCSPGCGDCARSASPSPPSR